MIVVDVIAVKEAVHRRNSAATVSATDTGAPLALQRPKKIPVNDSCQERNSHRGTQKWGIFPRPTTMPF